MSSSTSKRRYRAGIPGTLRLSDSEHACVAHSLDRSGVLLSGRLPLPQGPDIRVELRSTRGDVTLEVAARVLNIFRDGNEGDVRLGVEFVGLDDRQRATLESLINRVTEGVAPAPLDLLPRVATPRQIREALESIPLAHRISLAARAQLKERRYLREDTNLQVIEGLARNPNISIQEIKELARRHNILPSTVEMMAGDRRWFHDEELKSILATHSRASLAVAEEVIGRMKDRTLKLVVRSPGLHPTLKTKLLARFTGKELSGW